MKKFFQDFKKFISRGNIIDMAVGVIIGGAFSAIVTALTNKIIMPLINALLTTISGGEGLEGAVTVLKPVYDAENNLVLANSIYIDWGAFITAIIDFLLIAFTLFIILKAVMKSSELFRQATASAMKGRLTKAEKEDMKAKGLNYKDKAVVKAYREEKVKEAELAKAEAEEKAKAEAEEKYRNSTEGLLKEILATLKENGVSEADAKKAVKKAKEKAKA